MLALISWASSWTYPPKIFASSCLPETCSAECGARRFGKGRAFFTAKSTVKRLPGSVESDYGYQLFVKEVPMRLQALKGFAAAAFIVMLGASSASASSTATSRYEDWLTRQVRHQLVLLPFNSVFDNLEYKVDGTEVTLLGQVMLPTVKIDAENAVKRIEGVTKVVNDIEVLPVSPMDDQIRRAEFRATYGEPALQRYAFGPVPPIHIIVKGGHVTLEGVVDTQSDKALVYIRADGVPGVFSVTNNLRVESGE